MSGELTKDKSDIEELKKEVNSNVIQGKIQQHSG